MFLRLSIGFTFLSIVLNIVSLAVPYWYYKSNEALTYHFGLFQLCVSSTDVNVCEGFSDGGTSLNIAKALMILGLLDITAALVCETLKQFSLRDKRFLLKLGIIQTCTAGVMMIIGAIVFATDSDLKHLGAILDIPTLTLHAGFYLAVFSAISAGVAGILLILAFRQDSS